MKIPKGYDPSKLPKGASLRTQVLKLLQDIYGNKATGRVWNWYLDKGLWETGFVKSSINPCVYYKGEIMLVYIDDCILMSPSDQAIDKAITVLKALKQNFTIKDKGSVGDCLDVKINNNKDGMKTLSQPQVINLILQNFYTRIWMAKTLRVTFIITG